MTARAPDDGSGLRSKRRPPAGIFFLLLGVLAIVALVVLVYRPFVLAEPGQAYPSGFDSWGHLFKVKYLADQLRKGDLYPVLLPWWYDGLEVFRYWSPFPVYVLAGLAGIAGDVFVGGAWLVPLAAAFGGLSWLLFSRRIGWTAAILAGMAWAIWPDHIYLALVEGSLPRVVGTALFPLLFFFFLDSLELKRWPWSGVAVVVLVQLEILSHAMAGAMVCLAFSVFAVVYWLFSGVNARDVMRAVALLALGVVTSTWWLVPSLSGGLVSMSPTALRELVPTITGQFVPSDERGFLLGVLSAGLLAIVGLTWRNRSPLARSAFVCAVGGVLLTVPQVISLYLVVPFSHLLWPTRFTGLNAVPVILASAAWARDLKPGLRRWRHWLMVVAVTVVAFASVSSTKGWLYGTSGVDPATRELCHELARRPGWRVAQFTPPGQMAYLTSDLGRREQVYGFAWQGAKIAPQLVLMGEAMKRGDYGFAIDRAWQCGATDLVVEGDIAARESFIEAASAQGFGRAKRFGSYVLLTRPAAPQAFVSPYRVLAIGSLAGILSTVFPCVETGRPGLDTYTEDELARYDTIFLTGVEWNSKARAEDLVRAYARRGGHVVVDLTRFPPDILSGQASFLGVSAVPVSLETMPILTSQGTALDPGSLSGEHRPWATHFLQGLDQVDASFDYFGQSAAVLGSKSSGAASVAFIGLNFPYHAYLTRSAQTLEILGGLLGLEPGVAPQRDALPLEDYEATSRGWSFTLRVPQEFSGRLLVLPFAAPDSLTVWVDENKVRGHVVENLVGIAASPGEHVVRLEVGLPPLTPVCGLVSVLAAGLLAVYALTERLRARSRSREVGVLYEKKTARTP